MSLLVRGARVSTADGDRRLDLRLRRGRIAECQPSLPIRRRERVVDATGFLALPGLVNAHDHLGLDLLPRLGTPPYTSFYDWAEEIYHPEATPIREILQVPLNQRLEWGGLRNLIGGATSVVHHDPFHPSMSRRTFPVHVLRRYGWAHSLGYGDDLVAAHRRARGRPFILHAAEGTDARARSEVDRLEELAVLTPWTILVHGTAICRSQAELLRRRKSALVWCPTSSAWLYGRTAPVRCLKRDLPVALGTDSTLSGSPTLLEEIAVARETGEVSAAELLAMVTQGAATMFGMQERGSLEPGAVADLILLPDGGGPAHDVLAGASPAQLALSVQAGRVRLADPRFAAALELGEPRLRVDGAAKWVDVDVARLKAEIAALAGQAVAQNPLWQRLVPG